MFESGRPMAESASRLGLGTRTRYNQFPKRTCNLPLPATSNVERDGRVTFLPRWTGGQYVRAVLGSYAAKPPQRIFRARAPIFTMDVFLHSGPDTSEHSRGSGVPAQTGLRISRVDFLD
jgi:hypothetical protein